MPFGQIITLETGLTFAGSPSFLGSGGLRSQRNQAVPCQEGTDWHTAASISGCQTGWAEILARWLLVDASPASSRAYPFHPYCSGC